MDRTEQSLLAHAPLFSGLDAAALHRLLSAAKMVDIKRGEMLFLEGAPATGFYAVLEGWMKVFRVSGAGDQAVLGVFGPGETFAEAAIYLDGAYPANAEAVENARLAFFDKDHWRAWLADDPSLAQAMIAALARRLHGFTRQIEQLKTRNGEHRLASFLAELCGESVGPVTIHLPYDKALIAARLGMKPETLSRAFARLADQGVSVDGNKVGIANPTALVAASDLAPLRRTKKTQGL